jgi:acetyl esterase/lipase
MLPGDIDTLITADHAAVERRCQHVESGRGRREILVDQIASELVLHTDAEERVLYPAMSRVMPDGAVAWRKEHRAIRRLLSAVVDCRSGPAREEVAIEELLACMRAHFATEERLLLPNLRKLVGREEMRELGKAFWSVKRAAPSRPHAVPPTDASGLLDWEAEHLVGVWASIGTEPLESLPPLLARKQPTLQDAVRAIESDCRMPRGPGHNPVHERLWRQELRRPFGALPAPELPPVLRDSDFELWARDAYGDPMVLRVYRPVNAPPARLPILVWLHGGNWVMHTLADYDGTCRGLADRSGAVVVAPDYRLAPEFAFPCAHDDVAAAWQWLRRHGDEVGGDPERMAIGGEDAGGTMAAATARAVVEAGLPPAMALVLAYPITSVEPYGESMVDAADAAPLSRPVLAWSFAHAFFDDPAAAPGEHRVNLLGWRREDLALLPPTLVLTAGRDPLRSQGRRFADLLADAGAEVVYRRYDGMPHGFLAAPSVLQAAAHAQDVAAHFLRRHFVGAPADR